MEWKGNWRTRWGFSRKFSVGPGLGEVEVCMVENIDGLQLGYVLCFLLEIWNGP